MRYSEFWYSFLNRVKLKAFLFKYWQVLSIIVVLELSLIIRLINLNYNSPFIDEAMYILLGRKVLSATWQAENPFAWVGGMPLLYPPLSALFSKVGGVIGSRFLSALLGTASVFLLRIFATRLHLFGKKKHLNTATGIISALFLGISSVAIWLSRVAIYDMLAFTLLLLGLVYLQTASGGKNEKLYLLSSVFFFLAFLAKYSVAMMFPIIFIVLLAYTAWFKRRQMVWVVYYFFFVLFFWLSIYAGLYFSDLKDFFVAHIVELTTTHSSLISQFLEHTAIWYVLAVPSIAVFFPRKKYLPVLLLLSSFIPLLVHLITGNSDTLVQNTLYTLPLLLPLAAAFFVIIARNHLVIGSILLAVITAFLFSWSTSLRISLEQSWPNSTAAMDFLVKSVTNEEKILVESDDIAKLALTDVVPEINITGAFIFAYQDLDGLPAYSKAVVDGYFDVIELESEDSELALTVENNLNDQYSLVYDKKPFRIYRSKSQ